MVVITTLGTFLECSSAPRSHLALRCLISVAEVAAPLTMAFSELLLQCFYRFFDSSEWNSGRLCKFLRVKWELRFHVVVDRLPGPTNRLMVNVVRSLPLLGLLTLKLLFLITSSALDCLSVLLWPFKVGQSQAMPLTILPGHVDEFFLVSKHVLFVKLVNLNEFTVLVPFVQAPIQRSSFMSL